MAPPNPQVLRRYAKQMRSTPTVGERKLWYRLRANRLGVKFKRQVPIGPFIPDFVCFSKRLVVEVDGDSHTGAVGDRARDRWFIDQGWFVLRFSGDEIDADLDRVIDTIRSALEDPSQIHDPLNIHWRG